MEVVSLGAEFDSIQHADPLYVQAVLRRRI